MQNWPKIFSKQRSLKGQSCPFSSLQRHNLMRNFAEKEIIYWLCNSCIPWMMFYLFFEFSFEGKNMFLQSVILLQYYIDLKQARLV